MSDAPARLAAALSRSYQIERELGQGGMATVYLAEDLKHKRKVALKVLKPELAAVLGAERFVQEITTTAALQHPHILPLFDSGTADGFLFYVMPFIDGETLRTKLDRETQLGVDEAVRIASDVAEALHYAHTQGVVHRDIKPENILLANGRPMVADFGIALALSAAAGGRMTETGMSLGTPHYMSPEQATADKEIGPRSDVYSLASVCYEMLTGEPPHMGGSAQAIIMKIIAETAAPVTKVRKSVPPNVAAAVGKGLEKLPADRFESAKAFAEALGNPAFRHGEAAGDRHVVRSRRNLATTALAAATVLLTIALGWSVLGRDRAAPASPMRFDITPDSGQRLVDGGESIALASDGSRIVYMGEGGGSEGQLWVRSFDRLEAEPVPGTAGGRAPALSADGRSLAFVVGQSLYVTALPDGPVRKVADEGYHPAWGDDGTLYFANAQIIYRIRVAGGQPEPFTSPGEAVQITPRPLPGGRGLLLTVRHGRVARSRIAVVGSAGGEVQEILNGTRAEYAASGHIVYTTSEGTLLAAPFDLKTFTVGTSVALVPGVRVDGSSTTWFALSRSGWLVYRSAGGVDGAPPQELVWVNRTGVASPVDTTWNRGGGFLRISPSGRKVAIGTWIVPLDGTVPYQLPQPGQNSPHPAWTPDGDSLVIDGSEDGLITRRADGSGQSVVTWTDSRGVIGPSWSPDGTWLVYRTNFNRAGNGDILAVRPGVDSVPRGMAATEALEVSPAISPDGRWLAYTSDKTGTDEVYVTSFPDTSAGRWRISEGGGVTPMWAHSGRELFYVSRGGALVAVEIRSEPTFIKVAARDLFPTLGFSFNPLHPTYDVARDDRRFLMWRRTAAEEEGRLILVQHFLDELRTKVPQ